MNIDKLIKEVIRNYAKIMIRKKLSIKYEPSNYHVISDEKWLGFVLEQILSNAIKYSKSGTIEISVSALKECKIVIKDEGIGINTQDIPRVFEKGYTGYNGHSNKHSTGIGLYFYSSILLSFNKKSYTLIIVIPSSSCLTFIISFTTMIFLKESFILIKDDFSCFIFSASGRL